MCTDFILSDVKDHIVYGHGASRILVYDPKNPPATCAEDTLSDTLSFTEEEWAEAIYLRQPAVIFSALRWGDDNVVDEIAKFITPIEASVLLRDLSEYLLVNARSIEEREHWTRDESVEIHIKGKTVTTTEIDRDKMKKKLSYYIASDIVMRMAIVILFEREFERCDKRFFPKFYPKYQDVIKAYRSMYLKTYQEEAAKSRQNGWNIQGIEFFDSCSDVNLFEHVCSEDMETYEHYFSVTTKGVVSKCRSVYADMNTGYAKDIDNPASDKIIKNLLCQCSPEDADIDIQISSIRKYDEDQAKQKEVADRIAEKEKMDSDRYEISEPDNGLNDKADGYQKVLVIDNSNERFRKAKIEARKRQEEFNKDSNIFGHKIIHVGYIGDSVMTSINNLVIYYGNRPSLNDNDGNVFVSSKDWFLMQKKLNPIAVIVGLIYGDDEERNTLLMLHRRKTLALAIEKFAVVIKNDADDDMEHTKSIQERLKVKEKYKVSALLLSYSLSFLKEFEYEDMFAIKRRINGSTSKELKAFISDMVTEIENSGL